MKKPALRFVKDFHEGMGPEYYDAVYGSLRFRVVWDYEEGTGNASVRLAPFVATNRVACTSVRSGKAWCRETLACIIAGRRVPIV